MSVWKNRWQMITELCYRRAKLYSSLEIRNPNYMCTDLVFGCGEPQLLCYMSRPTTFGSQQEDSNLSFSQAATSCPSISWAGSQVFNANLGIPRDLFRETKVALGSRNTSQGTHYKGPKSWICGSEFWQDADSWTDFRDSVSV